MEPTGRQRVCPTCSQFVSGEVCPVCGGQALDIGEFKRLRAPRHSLHSQFSKSARAVKDLAKDPNYASNFSVGLLLGVLGFLLVFLLAYLVAGPRLGF